MHPEVRRIVTTILNAVSNEDTGATLVAMQVIVGNSIADVADGPGDAHIGLKHWYDDAVAIVSRRFGGGGGIQ